MEDRKRSGRTVKTPAVMNFEGAHPKKSHANSVGPPDRVKQNHGEKRIE